MTRPEMVVLLDEHHTAIGQVRKDEVHGAATPLHLAFSCYVFDQQGRLLVTRRALSKLTWPGVWTNSFCGHPAPDEPVSAAVIRRAEQELGARISQPQIALPHFRYRAVDASGIVENEVCPVYVARLESDLSPASEEVADWAWVDPIKLASSVALTPFAFSPWLQEQLPQLIAAEAINLEDSA